MKSVLKFPLNNGMNSLQIPGGLNGTTFGHQPGEPAPVQMWTITDSDQVVETVNIYLAVTGETLPEGVEYRMLGTVLLYGGAFVVHALLV
jgi:hypothetical protein